jgi:AcrR family transcriptional regulator
VSTGRRRLSAAERRDQLVAAAVAVLAEQGYAGATADAIAQRAGVSKGLLWHYFADLDDLFEQTAVRTVAVLRDAVAARLDLRAAVPEVVHAAVRAVVDLRETHGPERRAMDEVIRNLRHPDGTARLGQQHLEELYAGQEALFRRGQADGDVRRDLDPRALSVAYQGAVDSLLGYLDAFPAADPAAYAATVAEVLVGGFTPASAGSARSAAP